LRRLAGNTRPGTKVAVEVWRKGKTRELSMTLTELEPDRVARAATDKASKPKAESTNALGLTVSDITDAQRKELRVRGGVSVDTVDGAAARAGLRAGDVILAVQDTDITDAKQFDGVIKALTKDRPARLLVRRDELTQWVIVRPAGGR
jgi:serine protease Do